tara:strand:+ start:9012 stop:11915 length:2904 start_codon:yes stop_codon:yes gene_type:complete
MKPVTLSLADIVDQFGRALSAAGLECPQPIKADGERHRYRVEGDKPGTKNGWYRLHTDGIPAGAFGSWKTGQSETWRADIGRTLTPEEDAAHRARVQAMREESAKEAAKQREVTAGRAAETWKQASERGADPSHAYLVAKAVKPHGIGQLRDALVVPVKAGARLVGLQFIQADGAKKFLTGTPKRGAFHMVGPLPTDAPLVALAEGYATAASVHEATGWPVAVAFDAGNLEPVARAMRKAWPGARVVIAADNDHNTEGNPGISKANTAAAAVGGLVVVPEFAAGDAGTDWNDYAAQHGREATRAALMAGLDAAAQQAPAEEAPPSPAPAAPLPPLPLSKRDGKARAKGTDTGKAADKPDQLTPRFELREFGLYWCGVDVKGEKVTAKPPLFVCSPLVIEAVTRDARGGSFGRLVSFADADGVQKTCVIAARSLGSSRGDELRGALLERGLPIIGDGPEAQRQLTRYLMREVPAARARTVTRTGWHGAAFVLPSQTFGNAGGERYHLADEVAETSSYERCGTFNDWRALVSAPCGEHRRAIFALSCGFAGPLLSLIGGESGGFHLVGGSSSGKTTALRLAGSVWGSPESYWRQWRSTDNGLEAIAEEFNDTLLALDEIGQADPRIIGEVAYMLANGRGKQRARKEGGARAIKSWRVLLLSTGEVGTAALMNAAGQKTRAGHDVRLVEVPADAGRGFGLFDSAGGDEGRAGETSARALSLHLVEAASVNYGHAGPLFVERLTQARDEVIREGREVVQTFVRDVCPVGADGQVLRVASRFGLVCYAGELATLWGLTGWDFETVRSACVDAFQAWLTKRGTAGAMEPAAMRAQVRAFIEEHGGARFQDITTGADVGDYSRKDDPGYAASLVDAAMPHVSEGRVMKRAGYRKQDRSGRTLYLVFPEVFKREVCEGFEITTVCKALTDKGILHTQEADRFISRHITPQSSKKLPFYALDGDRLLDSSPADRLP